MFLSTLLYLKPTYIDILKVVFCFVLKNILDRKCRRDQDKEAIDNILNLVG